MAVDRMGLNQAASNNTAPITTDQSLKLAVAISLLRSKLLQRPTSLPESDALRWKRKAKEQKELLRLREDIKEAEDSSHCDLFSQNASCKCYFYGSLGKLSPKHDGDSSDRFNDVLRRRFLGQDLNSEDGVEHLTASIDFLVDLCDTSLPAREANFANWSHQSTDFILASLRDLLSTGIKMDFIEEVVSSLIGRLVKRMCSPSQRDQSHVDSDAQFYIQHLIRKLGSDSYIGQHALLSVSQRISMVAENLLFMDPFDEAFPNMHRCLYIMIQLIEFLVSDYLLTWSKDKAFDNVLFEEWVVSLFHARKALELHESRNGLYVLYMDRVVGQLAKQVGHVSSFQGLDKYILDSLSR